MPALFLPRSSRHVSWPRSLPIATWRSSFGIPVNGPRRALSAGRDKKSRSFITIFTYVAVLGSSGSAAAYLLLYCQPFGTSSPPSLNRHTFTPFVVTAREAVSPQSAILTVSLGSGAAASLHGQDVGSSKYPLWSVEFKQPEVQIARHYTPLPLLPPPQQDDAVSLRFYIRAVHGGEMSKYLLTRLHVGSTVHLRGPHLGFALFPRLGSRKSVVFLAGGTGIVPGLQVASAILQNDAAAVVSLLWSVRQRNEVVAQLPPSSPPPHPQQIAASLAPLATWWETAATRLLLLFSRAAVAKREITAQLENPTPIARELVRLKAQYGDRLTIKLAVDEEHTNFTKRDIQDALNRSPSGAGAGALGSSLHNNNSDITAGSEAAACVLHDQLLHTRASDMAEDDDAGSDNASCRCALGENGSLPGKNLFFVSGSDGFIAHYAGAKAWSGGKLTQGPVSGVAAQLQSRDGSPLSKDWLVLKL